MTANEHEIQPRISQNSDGETVFVCPLCGTVSEFRSVIVACVTACDALRETFPVHR